MPPLHAPPAPPPRAALLLSICVSFYTSNASNHLYGIVCCVANCALWMATLSSAFFAVVINACADDAQVQVLVGLFGRPLMRVPMMMFVWGSTMLFLEFILYFKINVDSGFNCSLCLGSCLVLMPLFFHCMHKMGWSALVVMEDAAACRRSAVAATPADIRARLRLYVAAAQQQQDDDGQGGGGGGGGGGGSGSGSSVLALDCDEFLASLVDPRVKATSVATAYARRLFDAHVEAALAAMEAKEAACIRCIDGAGKAGAGAAAAAAAAAAADATVPGVVHGVPTDAAAACATAVPIGADQLSAKLSLEGGSAFRRVPSLLL